MTRGFRLTRHLLSILLLLAVAGCGGGGSSSSSTAPTITSEPVSQTVTAGSTATFSVTASGTSPLSYQWYENSSAISGATNSSYTTAATTTANSGEKFTVTVTNTAGSVTSSAATLTVNAVVAPSITTQPVSQTVTAGATATFSVTASGTAPLAYQWYKNSTAISGATSASYTTAATTSADSGESFTVTVTNAAGNVTSSAATLTVNAVVAPAITTQPASQTVTAGATATFSVTATGTAPITYQWYKNSTAISGATSSSYTTAATTSSDSGASFTVTVTNAAGSVTSAAAILTVNSANNTAVTVAIDTTANRHVIPPAVYGYNFPASADYVKMVPGALVRWGGNASSRYNWTNESTNAANDWYFQNRTFQSTTSSLYDSAAGFVSDVIANGGQPITTLPMLNWVAKDSLYTSYSFSVATYGAQCAVNPYLADDGNGIKSDCKTDLTADPTTTSVPFKDTASSSDTTGTVYRDEFVKTSLAPAFNTSTTAAHFYNMDNEMDIWGSTHRDVHPDAAGYDELVSTYVDVATKLRTWDPKAIPFGPVTCAWWFYWNGANSADKAAHGGLDFLPFWLNQVYFNDKANGLAYGSGALGVFDVHAYPDGPSTSGYTAAQLQALATRISRDYWDPSYVSESGVIDQSWATQLQPNKTIPFRLPRLRALAASIEPTMPVSVTEWNAAEAGESDFSTALFDADTYGIIGREGLAAASRWTAAATTTPAFHALMLYTNPTETSGASIGTGFQNISVKTTNNGSANTFSSFASVNAAGDTLSIIVVNKDTTNTANVTFNLTGFTPSTMTLYKLASTSSTAVTTTASSSWESTQSFAPYSITLIVAKGTGTATGAEWAINPDDLAVSAGSSVTLHPALTSSTGSLTLTGATMDSEAVASYSGTTMTVATAAVTTGLTDSTGWGKLTFTAPSNPGFYRINVTGQDSAGVTQTQQGWLVVGNSAASLSKTSGDAQTGATGSTVTLTATFVPGSSGASAGGVSILFTTTAGSLSQAIVTTDSTGAASTTLTLPATAGTVTVTAEAPIPWGHPVVTFTETAQ
jgi:hypothetical protein